MGSLILVTLAERDIFGMKRERASVLPLSAMSTFALSALIWELLDFAMSRASCSVSGEAIAKAPNEAMYSKHFFIARKRYIFFIVWATPFILLIVQYIRRPVYKKGTRFLCGFLAMLPNDYGFGLEFARSRNIDLPGLGLVAHGGCVYAMQAVAIAVCFGKPIPVV